MKKIFLILFLFFSLIITNNSYAEESKIEITGPKTVFKGQTFQVKWNIKGFDKCYPLGDYIKFSNGKYWPNFTNLGQAGISYLIAENGSGTRIDNISIGIGCIRDNGTNAVKFLNIRVLNSSFYDCKKENELISNGVYSVYGNMPRCCIGLKAVSYDKYNQICINPNDGKCGKYENSRNSSDCKEIIENCKKENELIPHGVYPVGSNPRCCKGLKTVPYDKYNQICINPSDGKCGKYENPKNSFDCAGKLEIKMDLTNEDNKYKKDILAGESAFVFSFDVKANNEEISVGKVKFKFNKDISDSIIKADLYLDNIKVATSIHANIISNTMIFEHLDNLIIPEKNVELRLKIYTNKIGYQRIGEILTNVEVTGVNIEDVEGVDSGKELENVGLFGKISNYFNIVPIKIVPFLTKKFSYDINESNINIILHIGKHRYIDLGKWFPIIKEIKINVKDFNKKGKIEILDENHNKIAESLVLKNGIVTLKTNNFKVSYGKERFIFRTTASASFELENIEYSIMLNGRNYFFKTERKINLGNYDDGNKEEKICTNEYKPVCGIYNGKEVTFSNKCELEKSKAKYLFEGKCESFSENIKNSIKLISGKIIIGNDLASVKLKVFNNEYNNPYSKTRNIYRVFKKGDIIGGIPSNRNQTNFNLICQGNTKKMKFFVFPEKDIYPGTYGYYVGGTGNSNGEWIKEFSGKNKVNCVVEGTLNNKNIEVYISKCKPKPKLEKGCIIKVVGTTVKDNCKIYQKICEKFEIIGGGVELLNNKYEVKKGDVLKIKTVLNVTGINFNTSIDFDTVIYDENGKKLDVCVNKKIEISSSNQLNLYCELNYFKTHYPNGKKYKILTQLTIKQDGEKYFKELSNSFVIGKEEKQEIPENCISWYDGCNTCEVNNGEIGACTKRYCIRHDTPKCLKYIDEKDENVRYIRYIYKKTLGRDATTKEINYYLNKKQEGGKKYFENQIQDGVIKNVLGDLVKGKLFIDKNKKGYYDDTFIGNLYEIGLGRKIDNKEDDRLRKEWGKFYKYKHYTRKEREKVKDEIFDYFLESKEFEDFMKKNGYHFTNYSDNYHGKVGEFGKLDIKLLASLPLTIKRECAYGLTAIPDGQGNKVCVRIGDGKCGKYENKYNSIDCKNGCKNYNLPSGAKEIYNSKNCVIGYDKIGKINSKNYECINYPIYSYSFETKKQINHYLPNGFYPEFCKETGIEKCGKETVYIKNNETCCSGLTKVKVKGTNNFSKCVKIDNYCSEKEKDTYSSDCEKKKENKSILSNDLKIKIDLVVKKFMKKMEEQNLDLSQKISKLEIIIRKISIVKNYYKEYEEVFNYLNDKLKQERDILLGKK